MPPAAKGVFDSPGSACVLSSQACNCLEAPTLLAAKRSLFAGTPDCSVPTSMQGRATPGSLKGPPKLASVNENKVAATENVAAVAVFNAHGMITKCAMIVSGVESPKSLHWDQMGGLPVDTCGIVQVLDCT